MLQMIECSAPNVSILNYDGHTIPISLGGSLQVKKMQMSSTVVPNLLHCASTKLLSIAPNIETLFLDSLYEKVNTPMVLDVRFACRGAYHRTWSDSWSQNWRRLLIGKFHSETPPWQAEKCDHQWLSPLEDHD